MLLDFCNSMSVEFGLKGNVAREGDETSSFPGSIAIGREHVLLKTDFFSTPTPLGGVDESHMRLYCSIVAFSREVYCCRMLVLAQIDRCDVDRGRRWATGRAWLQ